jgi:hypothetical protein
LAGSTRRGNITPARSIERMGILMQVDWSQCVVISRRRLIAR